MDGFVTWLSRGQARVYAGGKYYLAAVPGRWRQSAGGVKPLAAGDRVTISVDQADPRINDRQNRTNNFTRHNPGSRPVPLTIAANLDLVVIIASASQPATPYGLVDRLLVTAALGGVEAGLAVNKVDLIKLEQRELWREIYRNVVCGILFTSAQTGEGVDELAELIRGKVVLFAGSSGVGKSSLANRIDPDLNIKTSEISRSTGKGRHITAATEFHRVKTGGWLGDTPGLRECGLWGATPAKLAAAFPEIAGLSGGCRYRNCQHWRDADCVVKQAVGSPLFAESRYRSYVKLLQETSDIKERR